MMNLALFINSLKSIDVIFIVVCIALVAIAVAIYFLMPVFNKKQYQEQRDNLRKREEAFKSNLGVKTQVDTDTNEEQAQKEQDNK